MLPWLNDNARGNAELPAPAQHAPAKPNIETALTPVNQFSHQVLSHCITAPGCEPQLIVSLEM